MSGSPRNVFEVAIDSALVRHVANLFETLAADLENEAGANPEELQHSVNPRAVARFEKKFEFAMLAHEEMIGVMKKKSDADL